MTISSEKLSKEKLQELKRYIFMEFFSAALQACIDTIGPEDTTKMFQPYNMLSGHAIVINLDAKNRFPHTQNDLLRAAIQFYYIMPLVWMASICNGFLTANSFSADVTRCLGQNLPLLCEGCNTVAQAQVETINPSFMFYCDAGLRKGQDRCKTTVRTKGGNADPIEEATTCILPVRVTEEEIDFWPVHYFTGYWSYATIILVDSVGEEKAREIWGPYFENAGASVALMLKRELNIEETDARGIGAIMDFLNDMSTQTGELTQFTPNIVTRTINQCPFAGPGMCYQYKKVADGVCRVINPNYEFKYESMMTRGDSSCKWVVSKR